jgi:hypothetical protein
VLLYNKVYLGSKSRLMMFNEKSVNISSEFMKNYGLKMKGCVSIKLKCNGVRQSCKGIRPRYRRIRKSFLPCSKAKLRRRRLHVVRLVAILVARRIQKQLFLRIFPLVRMQSKLINSILARGGSMRICSTLARCAWIFHASMARILKVGVIELLNFLNTM